MCARRAPGQLLNPLLCEPFLPEPGRSAASGKRAAASVSSNFGPVICRSWGLLLAWCLSSHVSSVKFGSNAALNPQRLQLAGRGRLVFDSIQQAATGLRRKNPTCNTILVSFRLTIPQRQTRDLQRQKGPDFVLEQAFATSASAGPGSPFTWLTVLKEPRGSYQYHHNPGIWRCISSCSFT